MRVEMFVADSIGEVEGAVNGWLEGHPEYVVRFIAQSQSETAYQYENARKGGMETAENFSFCVSIFYDVDPPQHDA